MPQFFSQNGEDCLLWELFKSKKSPGYYVEVGALDGIRFSNTYAFDLEGWNGICVEAHPKYIDLVRKNRPRSTNIFAAVGNQNKPITFYANARGSLSTIDPTLEGEYQERFGRYFTGFERVEVQMKTLTTILEEAEAPKLIDFLSIDIEGADFLALLGMDFDIYDVRIIVIEANDVQEKDKIVSYLSNHGYTLSRMISNNLFFCKDNDDKYILEKANVKCKVTHIPHTLDGDIQPVTRTVILSPSNSMTLAQTLKRDGLKFFRHVRKILFRIIGRSAR